MITTEHNYAGLFDFQTYPEVVEALSTVFHLPEKEIHERLFREALEPGWNVTTASRSFGITPFVYNDAMQRFYEQTNAFVFELVAGHMAPGCHAIDNRVIEVMQAFIDRRAQVNVLCLGDGIGSDSLRFAALGFPTTYFEFEGQSASLARHRFQRRGMTGQVRMIHQLANIPVEAFDVVICREVLEHVENPPEVIRNIARYLREGGIAIITESFGRVELMYPTHLLSNKQYDGRTEHMFVEAGFHFVKAYPGRRPMVFRNTSTSDAMRFRSLEHSRRSYPVQATVRKIGRALLRLVRF